MSDSATIHVALPKQKDEPGDPRPSNNYRVKFSYAVEFEGLSDSFYEDPDITPEPFNAQVLADYLAEQSGRYGYGENANSVLAMLMDEWGYETEGVLTVTVLGKVET